ncbi:17650_t:CDS:2 [Funneliformis caledonium]|uniref:17650_t:CDS:1 n=1 Tax=Funneliformis caledonium TaxID=1117310 RepID=A0A9N9DBU1_9GLOM|nr:17650_t:CDS:2 [Funneliformis caledonium]
MAYDELYNIPIIPGKLIVGEIDENQTITSSNAPKLEERTKEIDRLERKLNETSHVTVDSNPFNCIQLNEPTVNIRNDNGLNVCYSSNFIDASEFITMKATISPGISATSYIEIEKLQESLDNRKEDIDEILKSHSVYAIGIDFQNDSIRPCISCWVAKPLDTSILEDLEAMFDNQYEAINQILIFDQSDINQNLSESSSSRDHIIEEFGDSNSTRNSLPNDRENSKKEQEPVKKEEITTEYPEIYQKFTINVHLRAKYSPKKIRPELTYDINVYEIKIGNMLSNQLPLPFLQRRGCRGYFLDFVKVSVSPKSCISNDMHNALFTSLDTAYPESLNRSIEISNGRETNFEGQIGGEECNYVGCHTTGDTWSHKYAANILDKNGSHRTSYNPGHHSSKWSPNKNMGGFSINITQVVRFEFPPLGPKSLTRPKSITCPVIAHNLEISFGNLKDFDAKFAELARSNGGLYAIDNNISIRNPHSQDLKGKSIINRSFEPPKINELRKH